MNFPAELEYKMVVEFTVKELTDEQGICPLSPVNSLKMWAKKYDDLVKIEKFEITPPHESSVAITSDPVIEKGVELANEKLSKIDANGEISTCKPKYTLKVYGKHGVWFPKKLIPDLYDPVGEWTQNIEEAITWDEEQAARTIAIEYFDSEVIKIGA